MRGLNRMTEDTKATVIELAGTGQYHQKEIAAMVGLTEARISQIISEARDEMPADLREQAWRAMYAQLEALKRPYFRAGMRGDNVSARTFIKLCERQASLMGLDAPRTIAAFINDEPMARYILEIDGDVQKALS